MKWFKHDTSARNDTKIKLLKKKFGAEGYGVYFQMLEIVGENVKDNNRDEWGFVESIHTVETLSDESGVSPDKLRQMFSYMNEIGLLYKIDGRLCAPKILTRLDEYANKRRAGFDVSERKNELERQYRDNIGIQSGQYRALEENRTEEEKNKKRREKSPDNIGTYSSLESLKENDFQEIAEYYKVPLAFVKSKYDDLYNYCGSKGHRYKNYRLALMSWVKKDSMQLRKEQHERSKIVLINPK